MSDTPHSFVKSVPKRIAIFGASGHIGGPMARYIRYKAPQVELRLIGSNAQKLESLREEFPDLEAVQANYYDRPSLDAALAGVEGLMVLTQSVDEQTAMSNLVAAVRQAACLVHMIRVVGLQPDMNPRRIPQAMRDFGMGLEIQHPIARRVLDDAGMPVTYLNIGASFMDNMLRLAVPVQERQVLPWANRPVPYVDPREVGEAAARLLLSPDARHVYQFYTVNNGEPPLRASDVADMMSEVLLRKIGHDGSRETFLQGLKPLVEQGLMPAAFPEYLWNMFQYEEAHAPVWVPNQFLERTLGRRPTTMRAWLQEHRQFFMAEQASAELPASSASADPALAASSANGIDGLWDCVVSTPGGKEPHELVMRVAADGSLSGEMKNVNSGISMPLQNGRANGGKLSWGMQLLKPVKLNLKVEVQVHGDELQGRASAGLLVKVPIRGRLRKA
jgi:uncharacterized protein YbjT (DUF2867 family)